MAKNKTLNKFINHHSGWILFTAMVSYILIFAFFSLWKYYNFKYNGMDLAIINQVFYNCIHGNFFASSIHPPTYLGDHFNPIIFLLLPFYYLYAQPETLLALQTIILGLCAWPIFLIAKNILNKTWGLFFAISWLLNPFTQNINLFEFHFLAFGIFFILWAFYFYQKDKFLFFIIASFLAILVREDVAFVIFMFGIIALLDKRKIKWILWPIIFSSIYFVLALKITSIFSQSGQYKFLLYYSWLGKSLPEIIKNILLSPYLILARIFSLASIVVVFALMMPQIFLPIIKPKYLLLGVPIYIQLILGVQSSWLATILFTQYTALILPAIFISAIFGLKKLLNLPKLDSNKINLIIILLIVSVAYSFFILGPFFGSFKEINNNGSIKAESILKKEFLEEIPPNADVVATYELLAPLSSRKNIASLNYIFIEKQQFGYQNYSLSQKTEYLAIDYKDFVTFHLQKKFSAHYQDYYQQALEDWPQKLENFGLTKIQNGLALYQKNQDNQYNLVEILDEMPQIKNEHSAKFEKIKFLGFNKQNSDYQLFWQINFPLPQTYWLKLELRNKNQTIHQVIYPFAYNLLYTKQYLDQKNIQTNYWLDFKKQVPNGTYDLYLSLIKIKSGQTEINPDRSTKNVIEKIQIGEEIILEQITI